MYEKEFDVTSLRLASGQVLTISDWVDTELRATLELGASPAGGVKWDPFICGRGEFLQDSGRRATLTDVSLMRAGAMGLPPDYRALVFAWRATIEGTRAMIDNDSTRLWLSSTCATLVYNHKDYTTHTLSDLVQARPIEGDAEGLVDASGWLQKALVGTLSLPLDMRMGLSYGVRVESNDLTALSNLRSMIASYGPLLVRFHLRCWLNRPVE